MIEYGVTHHPVPSQARLVAQSSGGHELGWAHVGIQAREGVNHDGIEFRFRQLYGLTAKDEPVTHVGLYLFGHTWRYKLEAPLTDSDKLMWAPVDIVLGEARLVWASQREEPWTD